MKKSISDILHNADDITVERIADKKQAADRKTSDRIYRKCVSRMGADMEEVEVFKAETVRRAPKLYPVLGSVLCIMIICGTFAAMLKFKGNKPLPADDDPQITATAAAFTETNVITSAPNAEGSGKADAKSPAVTGTDKVTEPVKTKADNSDIKPANTEKDVVIVSNVTSAVNSGGYSKKTTSAKTNTAKTTAKTTSIIRTTTEDPYIAKPKPKVITTKDIIRLSAKKDDLTWSDFDEYYYKDIGSGLYVYEFKTDEGYTLRVGGGDLSQKPSYIRLVKDSTGDYVNVCVGNVEDFIRSTQIPPTVSELLSPKLSYGTLIADGVQSLEVSNTFYNNNAAEKLTYDQIKQIIPLILNVELIGNDNSYQLLSVNYSTIKITTHNGRNVTLGVQGGYFIIDGEGYKAGSASLKELDQFINSILANTKAPENVDLSSLSTWCWHDYFYKNVDMRNINETIKVSAFSDTLFAWNGMDHGITIHKNGTTVASFGGMPLWSAYFTDLNGDGSPELCMTVSFGSGMVDQHIIVYDIRNQKEYTLWERMEYDYVLFMENNELFVRKTDSESLLNSSWADDMSMGEKGRLKINSNDELVFVPVS